MDAGGKVTARGIGGKTGDLQGGAVGRLVAVTALWMLEKPANYFEVAWRTEPAGGGPILINFNIRPKAAATPESKLVQS